ncbi:MAG: hypothetical protein IJ639_11575 [Ruminococcus sp.]|nr:hypothetical protein [Ruminococcus sp.]
MNELRITRSRDIELYAGEEQLFGVTDFVAKSSYESYPIREYLSGEAFEIVNGKISYEIKMSVLSLFRFEALEENGFTLSAVDGDVEYRYDGCTVTAHERDIKAGRNVVDIFTITAKSMRKQVRENAG